MALKTKVVTVVEEGRDKGKVFLLTEMAARPAEKWAARAFLALAHSGLEVPGYVAGSGMAGLAILGFRALGGVAWAEAEPLLDEMMLCVKAMPDPGNPMVVRALVDRGMDGDDIEEVRTRLFLRSEVFALHTGFSLADVPSILTPPGTGTSAGSQSTETSPG